MYELKKILSALMLVAVVCIISGQNNVAEARDVWIYTEYDKYYGKIEHYIVTETIKRDYSQYHGHGISVKTKELCSSYQGGVGDDGYFFMKSGNSYKYLNSLAARPIPVEQSELARKILYYCLDYLG